MLISAFIISIIFMFFNHWNPTNYVIPNEKKDNSYLYEPVASLAPMVIPNLIEEVEEFEIPEVILDEFNNINKKDSTNTKKQ